MGHSIQGFIGVTEILETATTHYSHAHITALAQNHAFLPLTDDFYDELVTSIKAEKVEEFKEFYKLSETGMAFAQYLSKQTPIAYIETDYFGGVGIQSAVVWLQAQLVFGPLQTNEKTPIAGRAINQALRVMGITRIEGAIDEFESLNLQHFRHNEDFLETSEEDF